MSEKLKKKLYFQPCLATEYVQMRRRVGSGYFWKVANFCLQLAKSYISRGEAWSTSEARAVMNSLLLKVVSGLPCPGSLVISNQVHSSVEAPLGSKTSI